MKYVFLALLVGTCLSSLPIAQRRPLEVSAAANTVCKDQSDALRSGKYAETVLGGVWPPTVPLSQGITIKVGSGNVLFLHTDGDKFLLRTNTLGIPGQDVYSFLENLAASCKLPRDPGEAFKLLQVTWESRSLTRGEFEILHKDFITALSQYVSTVTERSARFMATRLQGLPLDASYYPIVYDNTWEHFEITAWDVPIDGQTDPMIRWVRELQDVAEHSFKRPFGKKKNP